MKTAMTLLNHPYFAMAWKTAVATCDATAIMTAWSAMIGLLQGVIGLLGAVLSVVYLYYRIKKARRDAK